MQNRNERQTDTFTFGLLLLVSGTMLVFILLLSLADDKSLIAMLFSLAICTVLPGCIIISTSSLRKFAVKRCKERLAILYRPDVRLGKVNPA